MRGWTALAALLAFFAAEAAMGATITVRRDGTGDYGVIQQALDVAADGDTVLIGPGEYTEWSWVRLPGLGYDVRSFAHLKSDHISLIGEGAGVTVIGPASYEGNGAIFSPKGISYQVGSGTIRISDLTVRHCYDGVFLEGTLYMDRCQLMNNGEGLLWVPTGPGGWIRDTVLEVTEPIFDPIGFDIGAGGLGSNIFLERCRSDHGATIRGVQSMTIRDCDMAGMDVYSGAAIQVYESRFRNGNVGISQSLGGGSIVEVFDSDFDGAYAALVVTSSAPGGRYLVQNTRLTGGAHGILYSANGAGSCVISDCDLTKGSGPMVECATSATPVTHDLRNNYWGTTDEATIRSWIIDHEDNPGIAATVLYSPFAGQSVPIEATTWGELKALWR